MMHCSHHPFDTKMKVEPFANLSTVDGISESETMSIVFLTSVKKDMSSFKS